LTAKHGSDNSVSELLMSIDNESFKALRAESNKKIQSRLPTKQQTENAALSNKSLSQLYEISAGLTPEPVTDFMRYRAQQLVDLCLAKAQQESEAQRAKSSQNDEL
jgi:hypothetical protein